jgi:Fur family ferric uptake transcriptional regulator
VTALITASTAGEEVLRSVLHARGLRCTTQRIAVMTLLSDDSHAGHLTAAAIFEQLRAGGGGMDLTTVYRTLTTLTDVGLIHALAVPDGALTFGRADHVHHHAVCPGCGRVSELATEFLAPVLERLGEVRGHDFTTSTLTLHAPCPDCAADSDLRD